MAAREPWSARCGQVAASFANSVRGHAGTGVLLAALAVALLRETGARRRAVAVVAILFAYVLVDPLAFALLRDYGDSAAHVSNAASVRGHPFWHPMYLGLGFLPNQWGIHWNDTVAAQAAARVDPSSVYLASHYEGILRHLYFQILLHHPFFVLHVYALKTAIVLRSAWDHFWYALLVLPVVLAFGQRRAAARRELLLIVPGLALAALPPVLTIPDPYDNGFLGGVFLIAILIGCGLAVLGRDVVVAAMGKKPSQPRTDWLSLRKPLAIAVGSSLALLGVGLGSEAATGYTSSNGYLYQLSSYVPQDPPQLASVVHRWDARALRSWSLRDGAEASLFARRYSALDHVDPGCRLEAVDGPAAHARPRHVRAHHRWQRAQRRSAGGSLGCRGDPVVRPRGLVTRRGEQRLPPILDRVHAQPADRAAGFGCQLGPATRRFDVEVALRRAPARSADPASLSTPSTCGGQPRSACPG